MLKKIRGKRAAADEPTRKKRKMADATPCKPGDISLGGDQTTQKQSTAMSEWSDDDGAPVAPPPSTEAPSRNMHTEVQSKGGEVVPEQQAKGVPEQQAKGVPEQQAEERPTVEAMRPPPQGARVDPRAAPRGSGRHRRLKALVWFW